MILICYSKCSTCHKAKQYLIDKGFSFTERDIKTSNPNFEELQDWVNKYHVEIKKLFNTSGLKYRELGLKNKLTNMSDIDKLKLLATDGMLVKRPILISDDHIYVGFKKKEWESI